ncbi:hypothetical protein BR93DRAFT_974400 [Coniochaeta sp. PMI_546]|nr:hypothetical protein BR93DRAFT_974400 [Coniochaeta sp. PMI_546]
MPLQGEPGWCEDHREYQSLPRTAVETILCVFVLAAYIPQYLSIITHGTRGISSRFVLFHSLSSTLTLALRLCHPVFYGAFNCVDGGPYAGWKAYSALLGFIQAAVQFVAAILLLALYISYRTASSPDDPVEYPDPGISSATLAATVSTVAITALPVSIAFLWFNQNPYFDDDDPLALSHYIAVYVMGLGFWMCLLVPTNIASVILQFLYQVRTVRALHDRGALSLVSLLLQAAALIWLAVAQVLRSRAGIMWFGPPWQSVASFLEMFSAFLFSINTQLAYFGVGLGFLAVFVVAFLEGHTGRIAL